MKNKVNKLKVAYFNQLGRKELDAAIRKLEKVYPDAEVELIGASYEDAFDKLKNNEADLVISELRDHNQNFKQKSIAQAGLMAILQKDTYPRGIQIVEKDDLQDMTCFIVAKPEEEVAELHLFKNIYQIKSPFIASNSVEEAALLVASGSGYFLMNEYTAALLKNDTLQKVFLLDHKKQMKQKITAFYQEDNLLVDEIIKLLRQEY